MPVERSAKEVVKEQYPDALVDDTGEWVYIVNQVEIVDKCPHCRQAWAHKVLDLSGNGVLGGGGDESRAWEDAAQRIKPKQFDSFTQAFY